MSKVLVSFATGQDYIDLLSIALPSFYRYGNQHDYDIFIPSLSEVSKICASLGWNSNRPTSWLKVPIIKYLLESYDIALWVDSDVVIKKFDKDIGENFDNTFMQGLVIHKDTHEGDVPNCGIWLLNKSSIPLLSDLWNQTDFIHHKWWEQGANVKLISENQDYKNGILSLPYEFNVHKNDVRFNEQEYLITGRFLHATMWNNRKEKMKQWAIC
jgi:hypothetical protein